MLEKGKIISRGHNEKKTHAKMRKNFGFKYLHAECAALLKSKDRGDTLLVVRVLKNGSLACSKPCSKCMVYIREHGIKELFYIDWDGNVVGEKIR